MPQLKAILEAQTAHYLSVVNPETTNPIFSFFNEVSLFAPLKHLTKEYGREHAVAYLKEYDGLQDNEQVKKKIMADMESDDSIFAHSKDYARELKVGLISFLSDRSIGNIERAINRRAHKAYKQATQNIKNQYGSLPSLYHFIDSEITSRLKALQGDSKKEEASYIFPL